MFIVSVNRKQYCERAETGTVAALVVRMGIIIVQCHCIVIQKIE